MGCSVIVDALGLSDNPSDGKNTTEIKQNVIVEAEMVAYSDTVGRVDEFWRIRSLIASTAIGPRHRAHTSKPVSPVKRARESTQDTDADDNAQSGWYEGRFACAPELTNLNPITVLGRSSPSLRTRRTAAPVALRSCFLTC